MRAASFGTLVPELDLAPLCGGAVSILLGEGDEGGDDGLACRHGRLRMKWTRQRCGAKDAGQP